MKPQSAGVYHRGWKRGETTCLVLSKRNKIPLQSQLKLNICFFFVEKLRVTISSTIQCRTISFPGATNFSDLSWVPGLMPKLTETK